jgi:acetyl esterase/lipase
MKLSDLSIRRPVLASMVSLALVLFGAIGYTRLAVREFPDVVYIVLGQTYPNLLRDEGEAYGAQLQAAGVDVVVHRAPGVFHGFFNMDAILDGAKVAQQIAFDAMRPVLHGKAPG